MKQIDPSLDSPDKFWHTQGRESDSGVSVEKVEAEKALDAAFLAAVSGGMADDNDEDWADVDADERLDQHIAWMKARQELLAEGLTAGQLAAISRYVADKHETAQSQVKAEAAKEIAKVKMSNSRLKRALAALGVFSVLGGMGWMMAPGAAAPTLNDHHSVTQEDSTYALRSLDASTSFKVGNKTIYTKAVKGKCDAGEVKLKMPSTKKVNWEWANGNVGPKVVKKGAKVCKYVSKAGVASEATYNAQGVMTALPKSFPKNPTVEDIQSLGLTPQSKVSPSLRIPQPVGAALAPAKLADTVTPIRAYPVEVPNMVDKGIYNGGFVQEGTKTAIMVEWELRGGSGVVDLGNGTKVPFVNGVARVTNSIGGSEGFPRGQIQGQIMGRGILPDYGQANLPSTTTQNWKLDKAKDASGIGSPFGVNANSAVIKQGLMDGVVTVFPDYSIR
jgi:hypothetical protein